MPTRADGLTEPQLEAVTHRGAPLVVVGGAGTGKTRVLCERFEALSRDGLGPGAILMLARDGDSAAALRERVEASIDIPFEELWIESFPAFCARLLRAEAVEAGLDPLFAPVTRADRLALLLERIDDLTLRRHEIRGNPAPLLASLLARIDRLKDEMIGPDEYRSFAERLDANADDDATRAHARREAEFARLFADHESLLRSRGALDAGGLVLAAFDLLHRRPHVRARLAQRFGAVLVDDFQDVTFAEAALLRLACAEQRELTIAADDDQATRASARDPGRALAELEREYADAHVVRLARSERCPRKVADAACAVVAPLAARRRARLRGRGAGEVRFWHCSSERAQAQQAAAHVERLIASQGVAPERVGLLVPSLRDDVRVLGAALEERALPYRVVGSAAYFERAEVRDVLAWLRLLADPGDSGAVVRALSRPPIELRPVDIARLTQLARRR
ncbi:MAG: ATP-dependent helicase UvrD/PcrA, partial [Thermoleophilaceae bacterium]|nr:ATP-dependent helicase UvrD/PcrA [Thermoleophilaceae bacterium]